jgi:hypothetical protein
MTTYADFRAQYPDGEIPVRLLSAYDEARTTWALDLASAVEAAAAEAEAATGPEALTRQAVAALLADTTGLRRILDELMTSALRLSATAEWETEDNHTFTERAVEMLAEYLPEATPHQTAEICDHFDLEFDEIDTNRFPEPAWDLPDRDEAPASENPHQTAPTGPQDPAQLLGEIEDLLEPLRTQPPGDWENDACFSVAYGLAEALGVPLAADDEPCTDPPASRGSPAHRIISV